MFKLIASDLDDTLLNSDGDMSEYTMTVLEKCMRNDIVIIPVSGRPFVEIPSFFKDNHLKFIVSANGARINNIQDGNLISYGIEKEKIVEILNIIDRYYYFDFSISFIYDGQIINFKNEKKLIKVHNFINLQPKNIEKVHFRFQSLKEKNIIFEELKCKVSDVNIGSSDPMNIEIGSILSSKGNALKYISNYLNIEKKYILTFGDNDNDISMFNNAGTRVAVKNANNNLKKISDYVCEENYNDGVAKFIENIFDFDK